MLFVVEMKSFVRFLKSHFSSFAEEKPINGWKVEKVRRCVNKFKKLRKINKKDKKDLTVGSAFIVS